VSFLRRHVTAIISITFRILFVTLLPVIPCVVSEWSVWSGCAEPCKTTYRVRRRHVIQEPRNGGEACPPLEERAGCVEYWTQQGTECNQSLSKSTENVSVWVIGGRTLAWVSRSFFIVFEKSCFQTPAHLLWACLVELRTELCTQGLRDIVPGTVFGISACRLL